MTQSAYPKFLTLKQGRKVQIRPLGAEDADALIAFFAGLPSEATAFLKHDVQDPDVVRRFIAELGPESVFAVVALTAEGHIVADATLHMQKRGWRRHVGEVRVVVAPEFQRSRLAVALIHELVDQASLRGLRKLEAQILDSQVGALTAFQHLGFAEEARLKDHALDHQGQAHDLLILTNTVEDLWHKMETFMADLEFSRDMY